MSFARRSWQVAMLAAAACAGDPRAVSSTGRPARVGQAVDLDGDGKTDGYAVDDDGDGRVDGVDTDDDGESDVPFGQGSGDGDGDEPGAGDGDGDGPPRDPSNCDGTFVRAEPIAPDMLIVQDRSGSMIGATGIPAIPGLPEIPGLPVGVDRWMPSIEALKTVTADLDDLIRFGLMTFPHGDMCGPGQLDVDFAFDNAGAISDALDGAYPDPTGFTPTAQTLEKALTVINDRPFTPDSANGAPYVLLVTDGEPTCSDSGSFQPDQQSIDASNAAIDALLAAGVKTFVVGYDVANAAGVMDGFAQRGGTERYIPVEDQASLTEELRKIAAGLVPCVYQLAGEPAAPTKVTVEVDGENIEIDDANGWSLDGKVVRFNGELCDAIQDGDTHSVEIIVPCSDIF